MLTVPQWTEKEVDYLQLVLYITLWLLFGPTLSESWCYWSGFPKSLGEDESDGDENMGNDE